MTDPHHIPVIVGIGEVLDREGGKEPRTLMVEAARVAGEQAPGLLARVDSVDVVSIISWTYKDIGQVVARDLGAQARHAVESKAGGEKPIRLLGEIAERIARGETAVALLCGAEAVRTRAKAAQARTPLDWGPTDHDAKPIEASDFITPHAARYGLSRPPMVYPLYELAAQHAWGQTMAEGDAETGRLWSKFSAAAAVNPAAWLPRFHSAEQVTENSLDNRLVSWPYRKLMVSNPSVNQGAAILITSLAVAREAGVAEDAIVYVGSGAWANEPTDFLRRERYDRSTAQATVLTTTLEMAGKTAAQIDLFEFYSCFPIVPKLARRTLGLDEDVQPSVTGGLTFFGGPANNYMTHALAAAVRAIRAGKGRDALLYGNGEFVTKHAAVLLSADPFATVPEMRDVQGEADAAADPIPMLLEEYVGPAAIESFTVIYGRDGAPTIAPVVTRTPTGERAVALADVTDAAVMARLTNPSRSPIGQPGSVRSEPDGLLHFTFTD